MPRLSDTMTEGTISRWLKHPGDTVRKGEILLEIETDKATMELESYESGVVEKVLVEEGQTVPIGQPIMLIGSGAGEETGESAPTPSPSPASARGEQAEAAAAEAPGRPAPGSGDGAAGQDTTGARPAEVGEGDTQASTAAPQASDQTAQPRDGGAQAPPAEPQRSYGYGFPDHETAPAPGGDSPRAAPERGDGGVRSAPAGEADGEVRASPMARRIARERGLDLASIQGSGPAGRVIRADVERAAEDRGAPRAPQPPPPPAGEGPATTRAAAAAPPGAPPAPPAAPAPVQGGPDQEIEEVPLNNIRRVTGRRMVESLQSAPHFYLTAVYDVTQLVALRKQINAELEAAGDDTRVSVNDLIVKACALTLRAVPDVNVSFGGDKVLRKRRIHIGIAVAMENGLIVPVIRDPDQKSVGQIARDSKALIEKARAGKLTPADYSGGTFTISNLGMFGIEHFTAVINPPEAAILAVGMVTSEPVVLDGQVEVRDRMRVTLSVDHRVLDGANGARYLQKLKGFLESPMRMLVE
jgi:pyruvate dehydrogenase E2 component (dihydrolipoamide acetyltransferase)